MQIAHKNDTIIPTENPQKKDNGIMAAAPIIENGNKTSKTKPLYLLMIYLFVYSN